MSLQKYIDKAEVLIEALPYITKFNGKIIEKQMNARNVRNQYKTADILFQNDGCIIFNYLLHSNGIILQSIHRT